MTRLETILKNRWHIDWSWVATVLTQLRTVMEVGIGPEDISMLPYFLHRHCERLVGIDPNPEFIRWARNMCDEVHEVAIGDEHGTATLIENGGSSYLQGSWCPTSPPNGCSARIVNVEPFSKYDDGKIDVLNVDCEGGEWSVFSQMVSRPALIGVELWPQNPHREKILNWLTDQQYTLRITTGPEGETMLWSRRGI